MYNTSRGILYASLPTADENVDEATGETVETTEEVTADTEAKDATVTEASANWTGRLAADD
ncbi:MULTISPECIES: hypothetical protein [Halostella]|uniref:hypothetical protein n=1 Tax=Halostella TaxID=1843185 RepID=UPI0010810F65|nr:MULTISPECIES: hypothetical protein [Halostella]